MTTPAADASVQVEDDEASTAAVRTGTNSRYRYSQTQSRPLTRWRRTLVLMARGSFALALGVAILFQGAVTPLPLAAAAALIGCAGVLAAFGAYPTPSQRKAISFAVVFGCLLATYVCFQAWSLPGHPYANMVWEPVRSLLGVERTSISVDPFSTRQAILPLLLPIAIYAAGLALFTSDAAAFGLLRLLAGLGLAFVVFGFVQVLFLPDSLLLERKTAYLGNLTSVFVNRNTAGTFLGLVALTCLMLFMRQFGRLSRTPRILDIVSDTNLSDRQKLSLGMMAAGAAAALVALALTQSRGAFFSCTLSFAIILPMLFLDRERRRRASEALAVPVRWRQWEPVLWIAIAIAIAVLFLGRQALFRMEVRGLDPIRICLYASTLAAFRDNWLFGTGFGTFDAIFPTYRDPACVYPTSTFLRAHNFYLEGLMGLGVIFVPLMLAAYGHVLRNLLKGLRARRRYRFVPIIGCGAVLFVTVHGLVDFSLQIPGMSAYFAAFMAAVTTISLGRGTDGSSSR